MSPFLLRYNLRMIIRCCLVIVTLFTVCVPVCIFAGDEPQVDLWARATPPGATSAAIYGEIANTRDSPLSLAAVEITGARHVMVHESYSEEGVMRMRHADVELPAGESIHFEPGGLHVMVMGLSRQFVNGCAEQVTFTWRDGTTSVHKVNVGSYGQQSSPEKESEACP